MYAQSLTFDSQISLKSLRARKLKGINRIAKTDYGHLYLREENISTDLSFEDVLLIMTALSQGNKILL